jgi:hypothetical protein
MSTTSRRFPVTVTQLPLVRCERCSKRIPHRPGEASDVLTKHYEKEHLGDAARTY